VLIINSSYATRNPFWVLAEWITCLALGGILFLAGIPKIINPSGFANLVEQYDLLPKLLVNPAAIFLPWLEITCAAALIALPSSRRGALWFAIFLIVIFSLAMTITMFRGIPVSCGCFTVEPTSKPDDWRALLRNAGILAFAFLGLRATRA
jgi:hypothetical protein